MSLGVPAFSIPGSFPQKGCRLRTAVVLSCLHCLAAGYLYGHMPGARREGKRPGLAQLILASVGRKLGAGGSPGFPLGQRWVHFISTQPSLCTTEQTASVGKEARREPGAARRTRHSTSLLPGQGTQRLCMAPGATKKSWSRVGVALVDLCAILLCCGPMLTCCRRGRYRSVVGLLAWPCYLMLLENV